MSNSITLDHALALSSMSYVKTDGCTLAFELGVTAYCDMHDRLLVHLVHESRKLTSMQLTYLRARGYTLPLTLTRLQADSLFKEGLARKVTTESGLKRLGYIGVKWIYYTAVRIKSILFS